ncbi:MAG TPA: hypothetical protein VM030_07560 [Acidimicrobiales bacterium]|nr:hypothetical protein [Acidimicrobiales bacterium]
MRRVLTLILAVVLLVGAGFAAATVLPIGSDDDSVTVPQTPGPTTSQPAERPAAPVKGVEGDLSVTDADGVVHAWKFLFADDGSYRLDGPPELGGFAYDARTGTATADGDGFSSRQRDLAPGPPDPDPENPAFFVDRPLGWLVRGLAGAGDASITRDTFLGRPAWRYQATFPPNKLAGPGAPDEVRAVVDQQTAFPVSITRLAGGNVVEALTVERLVVDPPPHPERFVLGNETVAATDEGWERVQQPEVAGRAGFRPLVPDLGDGFVFDEVAVASKPGQTGPEGSNPNPGPAVSFSYRRGLDQVTVTTRQTGPDPQAWADPFGGEGMSLRSEDVAVTKGALAGSTARIVLDAQSVPHAFIVSNRLVVTVGGALDRAGLVAALESLHEA